MINLAGKSNANEHIKEELYLAGIGTTNEKSNGEVPYTLVGKIGKWTLRRAWYYWIASVENPADGLPLNIAMELYNRRNPVNENKILGQSIRSGGDAGCSAPDGYTAQPVYNDELDEQLIKLGYKKEYIEFLKKDVVRITVGEVAKLCKEGKLNVERYVDCYHIDDQVGLNEFAKVLKTSNQ